MLDNISVFLCSLHALNIISDSHRIKSFNNDYLYITYPINSIGIKNHQFQPLPPTCHTYLGQQSFNIIMQTHQIRTEHL